MRWDRLTNHIYIHDNRPPTRSAGVTVALISFLGVSSYLGLSERGYPDQNSMVNRFPKFIHNWKKKWKKKRLCLATIFSIWEGVPVFSHKSQGKIHGDAGPPRLVDEPCPSARIPAMASTWKNHHENPSKLGYVWWSKTQICMGFGPPNSEMQKKKSPDFRFRPLTHDLPPRSTHHPRRTPCASQQLASLCPGSCEDLPSTPRGMLRWWRQPRVAIYSAS